MKALLLIMRYFLTWLSPMPIHYYLGLGLLPVIFITGIFWPRVAFGFAVWTSILLLAVPVFGMPTALRMLLSNRRLMIMRGFASKTILALFIYVICCASFLPVFAWFYGITRFPSHAAFYIFPLVSIYLLIAFLMARLPWGLQIMGILLAPLSIFGTRWLNASGPLPILSTEQFYILTGAVLLGWMYVLLWSTKARLVLPASQDWLVDHQHIFAMRPRLGSRFLSANNTTRSPVLSLMLGYPANNLSVLRLILFAGILGPLSMVLFVWIADIGRGKFSGPELMQMVMFMYLFSATCMGFQNSELVARLRLLWLKAPRLRADLWKVLEMQHWRTQATFLLLTTTIAAGASFILTIKPLLLLHYPLLLLSLHAHTSYYCICSRVRGWNIAISFVLIATIWCSSTWIAIQSLKEGTAAPLFMLELALFGITLTWRHLGRAQFARVDWQALKPLQMRRGFST